MASRKAYKAAVPTKKDLRSAQATIQALLDFSASEGNSNSKSMALSFPTLADGIVEYADLQSMRGIAPHAFMRLADLTFELITAALISRDPELMGLQEVLVKLWCALMGGTTTRLSAYIDTFIQTRLKELTEEENRRN